MRQTSILYAANDDVAGKLDNSSAERNAAVQRRRCPYDTVPAHHGRLDRLPRFERDNQGDHRTLREVDVLDWLFGFEQHGMLLDPCGLEIRLKSPKVIRAELVKQKVFSYRAPEDWRERKELSAIGA